MTDGDLLLRAIGPERQLSGRGVERLRSFAALVQKWNPTINMVAHSTLGELWHRHIIDSAQLFGCAHQEQRLWLDLGSGGGFPGIVIAILAADMLPGLEVALVESDKRKAVFLSEASRQLGLRTSVLASRIEALEHQGACVVSARALAPVSTLCAHAERHLREGGVCAFLKGASVELEIAEARGSWQFEMERVPSLTDARASALFLRGLKRV